MIGQRLEAKVHFNKDSLSLAVWTAHVALGREKPIHFLVLAH